MGPSIASGPPDAEEDERGLPRRKAATTIDTATAEEDVKDFDCACASSRASGLGGKRWTLRAASQMTKPLAELFFGLVGHVSKLK